MEDLTGRWANLSLNESTTLSLSNNELRNSRVLVAKLLTKRRINLEATTRTLKSMWRDGGNFDVCDLGNNIAMLIFDDEDDPKRILMQGPWSFDKYLIGLFRPDEAAMVEDAKFNTASFWSGFKCPMLCKISRPSIHLLWQRHNKSNGRWLASWKSSLEKVWSGRRVVDTVKFNQPRARRTHNLKSKALLLIQSAAALLLFPDDSAALLLFHSKSAAPPTIFSYGRDIVEPAIKPGEAALYQVFASHSSLNLESDVGKSNDDNLLHDEQPFP
nr:hypothetical protein CFP56_14325 [Quercus suber]